MNLMTPRDKALLLGMAGSSFLFLFLVLAGGVLLYGVTPEAHLRFLYRSWGSLPTWQQNVFLVMAPVASILIRTRVLARASNTAPAAPTAGAA